MLMITISKIHKYSSDGHFSCVYTNIYQQNETHPNWNVKRQNQLRQNGRGNLLFVWLYYIKCAYSGAKTCILSVLRKCDIKGQFHTIFSPALSIFICADHFKECTIRILLLIFTTKLGHWILIKHIEYYIRLTSVPFINWCSIYHLWCEWVRFLLNWSQLNDSDNSD